ncbi:MAG: FprA family A-type flavoprotein [Candidatus Methanodesulfokora sp.]|jgi:flavorubredoxin|nr:MAG: MBL fold hydrolase [Candidatus Korarchaeota archaeon]
MVVREILDGIFSVGAVHWDRRLFDELIPLPDGTSYNAYVVRGKDKIALIDTVDPSKKEELLKNLDELGLRIDYIISHHAEQDHSGAIPDVLEKYPEAKVVTNEKCKDMLISLLDVDESKFKVINNGETLPLGGRTLKFLFTPWVHWPETMVTYLQEDKILFTCDLFGSHLATSSLFADENVLEPAKRYYAEIMMPFRSNIKKHMEIISQLDVRIIAPSHGPIYRKPEIIMNAYREWISDKVKMEVVLPYVSMHGSTEKMVSFFIDSLIKYNVTVKPFNLSKSDVGELAMALVDAGAVVIGSPTMLVGLHPLALYAVYLINILRPKTRIVSLIGSYGWGGRSVEQLKDILTNLKAEFLGPVLVKGLPREKDFEALDKLAKDIAENLRSYQE